MMKTNHKKRPSRQEIGKVLRATSLDGITGKIEFDGKGDRKVSDYYVIHLREAHYPGIAEKVISASPPQAP